MQPRAQWVAVRTFHRRVKRVGRTDSGTRLYAIGSVQLSYPPGARHFYPLSACARCREVMELPEPVLTAADLELSFQPHLCPPCARSGVGVRAAPVGLEAPPAPTAEAVAPRAEAYIEEARLESAALLAQAEAQATALRVGAETEAAEMTAHAERIRAEAEAQAAEIRAAAEADLARINGELRQAQEQAHALLAEAETQAAELRAAAEADAARARQAAARAQAAVEAELQAAVGQPGPDESAPTADGRDRGGADGPLLEVEHAAPHQAASAPVEEGPGHRDEA